MALPQMGIRQSAGVYKNPTTGAMFNSPTGQIRIPRAKPAGTNGAVSGTVTSTNLPQATLGKTVQQPGTVDPAMGKLNTQRQEILGEIHRRGGVEKATGFAGQLNDINAKIRGMRIPASTSIPAGGTVPADGTIPSTGGGVSAVNNAGGAVTNLKPLQDKRKQLVQEVQRRGGRANAQGFAKQLDALDAEISGIRKTNATGTTPPPDAAPPADQTVGVPPGENPDIANTLFPNTRMFEPENYEGSPLYKFQVQEGEKALARSLAKRGLGNSGAAITEELNVPMRAAAQDTDRMTRVAEGNADRLYNVQNNEANRLERAGNDQWGRIYDTASLMAAQNPWQGALGGLDAYAGMTEKSGSAMANFLKDYYRRSSGGGGSAGTPIAIPSGPDYSNIDPVTIGGDYSSNKGWLSILNSGLAGLMNAGG